MVKVKRSDTHFRPLNFSFCLPPRPCDNVQGTKAGCALLTVRPDTLDAYFDWVKNMENKNYTEAKRPEAARAGRTFDSAYGFSFSIMLGLILFIGGLVLSLTLGMGSGIGLVFGIPLLIAGLVVPLFMMRDIFSRNEIEGSCPNCGTSLKTTDATFSLDCPSCKRRLVVRNMKFFLIE